jgi:hypothetical protein
MTFRLDFICRWLHILGSKTACKGAQRSRLFMNPRVRQRDDRSEFTAAATVVAVLAVGTLTKLGFAAQLFHLAR